MQMICFESNFIGGAENHKTNLIFNLLLFFINITAKYKRTKSILFTSNIIILKTLLSI